MTEERQKIANRFAEILATERKRAGYSYYELSKRSGLTPAQLERIESGRHCPRLDTILKICETLYIRLRLPDMVRE